MRFARPSVAPRATEPLAALPVTRRRCGGDGPAAAPDRRHGTWARPELEARRECPLRRSSPASWPPSGKMFFPPHSVSSIFVHELYLLFCQLPHAQLFANIIQYTSFRWALFAPFFSHACARACNMRVPRKRGNLRARTRNRLACTMRAARPRIKLVFFMDLFFTCYFCRLPLHAQLFCKYRLC